MNKQINGRGMKGRELGRMLIVCKVRYDGRVAKKELRKEKEKGKNEKEGIYWGTVCVWRDKGKNRYFSFIYIHVYIILILPYNIYKQVKQNVNLCKYIADILEKMLSFSLQVNVIYSAIKCLTIIILLNFVN